MHDSEGLRKQLLRKGRSEGLRGGLLIGEGELLKRDDIRKKSWGDDRAPVPAGEANPDGKSNSR